MKSNRRGGARRPDHACTTNLVHWSRLAIGFQVTGGQIQSRVEIAYRTDWAQVLTTAWWWGRIDDFSCRALAEALRVAADAGHPVRIHAFAAAARDLFRHSSLTFLPHPKGCSRGCRSTYVPHVGLSDAFNPEAGNAGGSWHDELIAVIDELSTDARVRRCERVTKSAEAARLVREALSALQALYTSVGDYLEQVLQPLHHYISRDAVQAFVLEARREPEGLAACHGVGKVYVEDFGVKETNDKSVSLEVEGFLERCRAATPKL